MAFSPFRWWQYHRLLHKYLHTPTPTETPFRFKASGGNCGPDLAKLQLTLQSRVYQLTRAVNGTFCGSLVILHEKKTNKEYLGLLPCSGKGEPYIFQTRPRELLNYYQFVNIKFRKGKRINTNEFGELNRYIASFQTYYPLDQCSKCGFVSQPVSPPEFLFPGGSPSATPAPPSAAILNSVNTWLESGEGFSSSDLSFVFPTPTINSGRTESPTPSRTAELALSPEPEVSPASQTILQNKVTQAEGSSPALTPSPTATHSPMNIVLENDEPPADLPEESTMSYSLYTLILVPLMVLGIIWRRSRIR